MVRERMIRAKSLREDITFLRLLLSGRDAFLPARPL
jgi:hypothetical protein